MTGAAAIVAIGRNEGERLERCLDTALTMTPTVVYVDSGSTDGSAAYARAKGCHVVELDLTIPFTAARARNAGFNCLEEAGVEVEFVQFVDGDCEIVDTWLATAVDFLRANTAVAAVCGRRCERYPERSIYNQLCDWEWAVRPGPAQYCGGDVLMRAAALREVGGYRDSLIAGEEPELCVRLRGAGWKIHALDAEMTLHDAAMTRFGQWWNRMARSGYAYVAGAWLHGSTEERHWVWETMRTWIWSVGPFLAVLLMWPLLGPLAAGLLLVYPLQLGRQIVKGTGSMRVRFLQAGFNMLARFPELHGQLKFLRDKVTGKNQIIEYK